MRKVHDISGAVYFEEKQRFPKWILWLMLSPVLITVGLMVGLGAAGVGEREEMLIALAFIVPLQALMLFIFLRVQLEKVVTSNGFYYRWNPVQKKYRYYEAREISKFELKKGPVMKYGWSWLRKYGTIHNVSDGKGIQLVLPNGKRIYFGSADAERFHHAMEKTAGTSKEQSYGWIR